MTPRLDTDGIGRVDGRGALDQDPVIPASLRSSPGASGTHAAQAKGTHLVSPGRMIAALLAIVVLLTLAVVARAALRPSVPLLTGNGGMRGACYTFGVTGLLIPDPTYGTAIIVDSWPYDRQKSAPTPVMWPLGYTARRVEDQVEVVSFGLLVAATTGHRYSLDGGFLPYEPYAFLACGAVQSAAAGVRSAAGSSASTGTSPRHRPSDGGPRDPGTAQAKWLGAAFDAGAIARDDFLLVRWFFG